MIMTLHRPSNVDEKIILKELIDEIINSSFDTPIIFPVREDKKNLKEIGINHPRLKLILPLSYLEFNYLVKNSLAVITIAEVLLRKLLYGYSMPYD